MKKSIFLLAALFVATFANAQITLEHTFNSKVSFWNMVITSASVWGESDAPVIGEYYYEELETAINIYDAVDYSLLQSISKIESNSYAFISRGLFTIDNRWAYLELEFVSMPDVQEGPYCGTYAAKIKAEDGQVLASLGNVDCGDYLRLIKVGNAYKLTLTKEDDNYNEFTEIYSLPGDGNLQAVSTPSAPKRTARKIARDKQVLVETEDNTYTLTGAELK